jgi:hypothetical protein
MKKLTLFAILFLAHSFSPALALNPNDFKWELKEEKDKIKIYRADRHKETGIVPIKAASIIDHSMPRILSVIANTDRKREWVPKLIGSSVIENTAKYSRVEYALYDSPWPFNDRSFVISTSGKYNIKEESIYISIHSVEHPKMPHNKKHVRGHTYLGNVYLKRLANNKTFFEITLLTDFSGNIPAWIINIVQKKWPYKFFKNIKVQLQKPDIIVLPKYQKFES